LSAHLSYLTTSSTCADGTQSRNLSSRSTLRE
jgi:hypothetical protein